LQDQPDQDVGCHLRLKLEVFGSFSPLFKLYIVNIEGSYRCYAATSLRSSHLIKCVKV